MFSDLSNYVGWNALFYCKTQALANGAMYFGLQFGYWCYYGSNTVNQLGALTADTDCSLKCTGNQNTQIVVGPNCGGYFRNSVYQVPVPMIQLSSIIFSHSQLNSQT